MIKSTLSAKVSLQVEAIKNALQQSGSVGLSLGEIARAININIPHRTLQRRLEYLRAEGIVTTSGDTRSTRYYFAGSNVKGGLSLPDGREGLAQRNVKGELSLTDRREGIARLDISGGPAISDVGGGFALPDRAAQWSAMVGGAQWDPGLRFGHWDSWVEETAADYSHLGLSKESEEILSFIGQPHHQRKQVGYNREFLELYQPNITNYLSVEETAQLFRWGQTPGMDQAAGTFAKEILQRLLIDLSYNSSRLEGNTYSLLETERLLRLGEEAANKSAIEALMILNHKDAIEFLVQSVEDIGLNRYTILNLHALLANNLLPDPANNGRLRSHAVGIGRSAYVPLAIPQIIEEMFELILVKARQILNPFEQAFFLMVHLPYLQPFEDVNKRVSRLAANIPLNNHNLAPISFIDVPGDLYLRGMLAIYELNRIELLKDVFLFAYERSSGRYASVRQSIGEPDMFRMRYRQAIRELVTTIVSSGMIQTAASAFIKKYATRILEKERKKFIEYVETELLSLHEGNSARYYVSPSEFDRWNKAWKE